MLRKYVIFSMISYLKKWEIIYKQETGTGKAVHLFSFAAENELR